MFGPNDLPNPGIAASPGGSIAAEGTGLWVDGGLLVGTSLKDHNTLARDGVSSSMLPYFVSLFCLVLVYTNVCKKRC